jgi:hypothetical protein
MGEEKPRFSGLLNRPETTPLRGDDGRVLQNPPTIPPSAANALVYASPTGVDLAEAAVPTPPRNSPERRTLLPQFNVVKAQGSGRKRKSKKSKRKTRKSRRRYTRRH